MAILNGLLHFVAEKKETKLNYQKFHVQKKVGKWIFNAQIKYNFWHTIF